MAKVNVRLIRKIIKHILAEPQRYFQEDVIVTGEPGELVWGDKHPFASCGTAACIGGWAYILSAKRPSMRSSGVLTKAQKALGLTDEQSSTLFSGVPHAEWPMPFGGKYDRALSPRGRARVAAQLLDKVIQTKGEILNM